MTESEFEAALAGVSSEGMLDGVGAGVGEASADEAAVR
jgi:hypothetical protein